MSTPELLGTRTFRAWHRPEPAEVPELDEPTATLETVLSFHSTAGNHDNGVCTKTTWLRGRKNIARDITRQY